MKIVFMGTPEFASVSLGRLYNDGHELLAVFTKPDKQKDRGMKLWTSPVKNMALEHGTPVLQPDTLKDGFAAQILRELQPDLIAVVAYGKLLPADILAIPRFGCINIHGSLLPKYRGAAPVQWAVLNGDKITGVTSMYMAPEMDAGDIIMTKMTEIGNDETSGALFDRLGMLGAELLSETITALSAGTAARIKQNDAEATYAPPITKDLSPIDWLKTPREIMWHVRGLNPKPLATADICGTVFKIYAVSANEKETDLTPGRIVSAGANGIEVACHGGTVSILELQAPGGRRMPAADYLRGHPICL